MDISDQGGKQKGYISYMLRMWRDSDDEGAASSKEPPWRASLQSPRTGEVVGFANLDDLFEFLYRQVGLGHGVDHIHRLTRKGESIERLSIFRSGTRENGNENIEE